MTKSDFVAFIAICFLSTSVCIKLFFPYSQLIITPDFSRSDSWHLGIVMKYVYQQKLRHNNLPLWSPKINSGFPILGDGQTGLFFFPNLVLFKLLNFATAFNLSFVLTFILFGLGMYVWLRLIGLHETTALFGALTLDFSGITFARLTHLAVFQSLSLLPWVVVSTYYLYKKRSFYSIFLFAFVSSQQLLTGFTQTSVISILFAFFYFLQLNNFNLKNLRYVSLFVMSLMLTVAFSAIHIIPAQEFIQQSVVPKGFAIADATRYGYPLKHLLTFLDPFLLGNPKFGTYPDLYKFDESIFWENSGYIGLIPFLGILLLVLFRKKLDSKEKMLCWFLLAVLSVSFLLMLGKYSPVYLVYLLWPFNQFRVPSRFIWTFVISLVTLATIGLEIWHRSTRRKVLVNTIILIFTAINTCQLIYPWWDYHLLGQSAHWLAKPQTQKYTNGSKRTLTLFSEDAYYRYFSKGWEKSEPYEFLKHSIAPNSNLIWNIPVYGLVAGRKLRRSAFIDNLLQSSFVPADGKMLVSPVGEKLLNLLSIDTVLSLRQLTSTNLVQQTVFTQGLDSIYIYKNLKSLPRAYLVNSTSVVKTVEEAAHKLNDARFIPGESILTEENLQVPIEKSTGSVEIVNESDKNMEIKTFSTQEKSILNVTDTYFPGWQATIDGITTKIYPANISQRAVVVPQGTHSIIFNYQPKSLMIGAAISGTSITLSLFFVLLIWIRNFTWISRKKSR